MQLWFSDLKPSNATLSLLLTLFCLSSLLSLFISLILHLFSYCSLCFPLLQQWWALKKEKLQTLNPPRSKGLHLLGHLRHLFPESWLRHPQSPFPWKKTKALSTHRPSLPKANLHPSTKVDFGAIYVKSSKDSQSNIESNSKEALFSIVTTNLEKSLVSTDLRKSPVVRCLFETILLKHLPHTTLLQQLTPIQPSVKKKTPVKMSDNSIFIKLFKSFN